MFILNHYLQSFQKLIYYSYTAKVICNQELLFLNLNFFFLSTRLSSAMESLKIYSPPPPSLSLSKSSHRTETVFWSGLQGSHNQLVIFTTEWCITKNPAILKDLRVITEKDVVSLSGCISYTSIFGAARPMQVGLLIWGARYLWEFTKILTKVMSEITVQLPSTRQMFH